MDQFYRRFLDVVAAARTGIDAGRLNSLADGRVFTGKEALGNGLVDALGYMADAIGLAKKRANVKKAKVVMYHRPMGYRANAYSAVPNLPVQMNLVNISAANLADLASPKFMYVWTGQVHR